MSIIRSHYESLLAEHYIWTGGRLYFPGSTLDLSGVYDDMMENLRVRYVITYKSSTNDGDLSAARTVRIELVNPKTGGPLEIVDASGKAVPTTLFVEASYIPRAASMADLAIPASKAGQE